MSKTLTSVALGMTLFALGCDDEKPAPQGTTEPAPGAEVGSPAEKTAAEKAAEAKAAEDALRLAKEEAAQKEKAALGPLLECCSALGQRGFTERSMTYMAASKVCSQASDEKKALASALEDIKKELKEEPLPEQCASH